MLHKMLAIYQDKLDRKMVELGNEGKDCCERCDKNNSSADIRDHFHPNIEAFQAFGEIVCDDCAEEAFEENGQFGLGA